MDDMPESPKRYRDLYADDFNQDKPILLGISGECSAGSSEGTKSRLTEKQRPESNPGRIRIKIH